MPKVAANVLQNNKKYFLLIEKIILTNFKEENNLYPQLYRYYLGYYHIYNFELQVK